MLGRFRTGHTPMNEDAVNMQIRKFLKKVGITSQREIESALREALADGRIAEGNEIATSMTLKIDALDLSVDIDDRLKIE